ncbi:MAG: hypothetical protein WA941_23595 [Nitrososphaeraceae archaeon]
MMESGVSSLFKNGSSSYLFVDQVGTGLVSMMAVINLRRNISDGVRPLIPPAYHTLVYRHLCSPEIWGSTQENISTYQRAV